MARTNRSDDVRFARRVKAVTHNVAASTFEEFTAAHNRRIKAATETRNAARQAARQAARTPLNNGR